MLRPIALLGAALLASCASFDLQRERILLRYTPDTDVLDVVFAYEGPAVDESHTSDTRVRKAADVVTEIAGGKRHVLVWAWPFEFDLDAFLAEARAGHVDTSGFPRSLEALLAYESSIRVVEAKLVTDAEGRPAILQHLRFTEATRFLRLVDAFVNEAVLLEVRPAEHPDRAPALVRARAERGGSWARFDGTDLVVSIPSTASSTASALGGLLLDEELRAYRGPLLRGLSAFRSTDGEVELTYSPGEDGWIEFEFDRPSESWKPGLAERLADDGLEPQGELESELRRIRAGT